MSWIRFLAQESWTLNRLNWTYYADNKELEQARSNSVSKKSCQSGPEHAETSLPMVIVQAELNCHTAGVSDFHDVPPVHSVVFFVFSRERLSAGFFQ